MAHFARIDDGGIVREVIVIDNDDCGAGTFPASEAIGQAFIAGPHPDCLALEGNWLQTSYSGSFRGTFGQIGFSYDPTLDVFAPPAAPEPAP
jgi:hypothetical protein